MNFAQTAKNAATTKLTENGAMAYSTTDNALLDLFAQIGALRPRTTTEIENKFANAFAVDPYLATKMMFYAGNIRGGLGERRTFRICLNYLARVSPETVIKNLEFIPHFNRWDSLFTLIGTPAEEAMWEFIANQLNSDMANTQKSKMSNKAISISLLAKWMPTETASSKDTRKLAKLVIEKLEITPRTYRKILSALRKQIGVVESLMSAGKWDKIDFSGVPSYAMKHYRKAFDRHEKERFAKYQAALVKGETKINASTLFPYDLVKEYWGKLTYDYRNHTYTAPVDTIIEEQWKSLPNYVDGANNIVVMADVSGSMSGRPMWTSIGLATYFAQRNNGDYKNLYMTFTSQPHFISIEGLKTLASIVGYIKDTDVGYSTNLDRAFELVLTHAIENGVKRSEMPKALVVISDMEIDPFFKSNANFDFVQKWKSKFERYGYTLPKLVLYNVEARNDTFLSKSNDVILVSGQSPSTFKNLCGSLEGKTAWDFMLEVLNDKMYDCIRF
jgi:hypothetical protein